MIKLHVVHIGRYKLIDEVSVSECDFLIVQLRSEVSDSIIILSTRATGLARSSQAMPRAKRRPVRHHESPYGPL